MAQLDELLTYTKERGASDLHLVAGLEPRLRLHGKLRSISDWPPMSHKVLLEVFKEICPPERWARFVKSRDIDFAYAIEGVARFRVNLFYQEYGCGGVMRVVPDSIIPFHELLLPAMVEKFAHLKKGLVLMTGATGSGKSTTMASLIDLINRAHTRHIVTIEDPLEFIHRNKQSIISHREIGMQSSNFGAALRSAIRQDADVILVGEMRDTETISLALQAAEMGALVFSSLHSNNAASAVDRIVGVYPTEQHGLIRSILAETLQGVIAQILLPLKGKEGRRAAVEVLRRTPALPNVIRDGQMSRIYSLMSGEDLLTMDDTLCKMVEDEVIEVAVARDKCRDKERTLKRINRILAKKAEEQKLREEARQKRLENQAANG
ncbi:MAG: PilT/PilU family type 4a pilus ATPase [Myxococcota bacterium]